MNPDQFRMWLKAMAAARHVRSANQCAKLLGIQPNTIYIMKRKGCDRRTALACMALLHGLEPYGS